MVQVVLPVLARVRVRAFRLQRLEVVVGRVRTPVLARLLVVQKAKVV